MSSSAITSNFFGVNVWLPSGDESVVKVNVMRLSVAQVCASVGVDVFIMVVALAGATVSGVRLSVGVALPVFPGK